MMRAAFVSAIAWALRLEVQVGGVWRGRRQNHAVDPSN